MVTQTVIKANSETQGRGSELYDLPWQLTKTQSHKVKRESWVKYFDQFMRGPIFNSQYWVKEKESGYESLDFCRPS